MQPPNRLGIVLDYFATAYRFATQKDDPRRRMAFGMLSDMAETARYKDYNDTVDTAEAVRLAITSAWVYSGIKLISDRVSSSDARFRVKLRSGEDLIDQRAHPFEILMDRPNSLMTRDFILRYTTFWMHLMGNAYIFVSTPFPGMGTPEELWPLPANKIRPLPTTLRISRLTGQPCVDYEYKIDNDNKQILPGENVVHIRFANIFDYWQGLSPLTAMMDGLKLDRYQQRYLQGFFGKDNAIPTAIISVPAETNPYDFEVLKQQIREQFGEGRRSAIIRSGDLDVKTITQTIQEMAVVESRKFSREEINHVLGIPDGLITGGQSGDSRLATEITFVRNTVQPYLDLLAAEFTAAVSPYYGENIIISAPNIVPQDRALRVQEYAQYAQDRSINENRRELDLQPLDIIGVMGEINDIRMSAGLEEITTPFDDITLDLMLRMPTRLLAFISSNTYSSAGRTGLRIGQLDAAGEPVADPMEQFVEDGGDPSAPPGYANVEVPPSTPDLPGMQGPQNEQGKNAGRSVDKLEVSADNGRTWTDITRTSYKVEAYKIGQREELMRWKKVALKAVQSGENPSSRKFESAALSPALCDAITKSLDGATEPNIHIVFSTILATLHTSE